MGVALARAIGPAGAGCAPPVCVKFVKGGTGQYQETEGAEGDDPFIFVIATAEKNSDGGGGQHEVEHPEMEVFIGKKASGDDWKGNDDDGHQQAVYSTGGG
tara:strand:- start:837 stop:1139 length:303 start_codon:yes stop_codon:yes gene_type:complete